jgi:hypothetical protein
VNTHRERRPDHFRRILDRPVPPADAPPAPPAVVAAGTVEAPIEVTAIRGRRTLSYIARPLLRRAAVS